MHLNAFYPITALNILRDAVVALNSYFEATTDPTPYVMVNVDEFSDTEANLVLIYDDPAAPIDTAGDSYEYENAQRYLEQAQMFICGFIAAQPVKEVK
jgi:hypothetical protein